MSNIKVALVVAYDGTSFDGWQDNHNNVSVEGCLKSAFFALYQKEHALDAASRTDKGVHARNQIVVTYVDDEKISLSKLGNALNSKLPSSIRVKDIIKVPDEFHPSLDTIQKTYSYLINLNDVALPFDQKTSWHLAKSLDLELIQEALPMLTGKKDFSGFTNSIDKENVDPICDLKKIEIEKTCDGFLSIKITGDRFLYKMCRILVGTLVAIGLKKINTSDLTQLFTSKNRTLAGVTAPAQGLILENLEYKTPLLNL